MAFQDTFRFSLKSNPTTWLYWNNGTLGTSTTARYIQAPHKWKETVIDWTRSNDKRGLIRSNAAPYQFVEDGASILRSLYYGGSCEVKAYLLIERLKIDTTGYEDYFEGEIDLGTIDNGVLYNGGSRGVSAAVIPGGIDALLTANENIPYEIELNPATSDLILMDGTFQRNNYRYGFSSASSVGGGLLFGSQQSIALPLFFINTEAEYTNGISNTATFISMDGPINPGPSHVFPTFGSAEQNNYMFEAVANGGGTIDVTVNVDLTAQFNNTSLNVAFLQIRALVWHDAAANWSDHNVFRDTVNGVSPSGSSPAIHCVGSSAPITLSDKDRLYVVINATNAAGTAILDSEYDIVGNDDAINLGITFRLPTTYAASKPYRVVVSELLEMITGIPGVLQSDLLTNSAASYVDCYPYNLRITCGDALRQLAGNAVQATSQTTVYPKIRITWADVWKDLRCRLGAGMDVRNGKIVIERASSFFNQHTIIADLGEVKSLNDTVAKEYMATSAKWGYATQSYDKLNGRDEPITESYWKMPSIRNKKEEDNLCSFRSDMYGIEYVRANLLGKKTTDAKTDNDTFVIETEYYPTPIVITVGGVTVTIGQAYPLYRPQIVYTQPAQTGLLYPTTAYNLTQTGKRNLLRSGDMIHSALYGLDNEYITFQTTDKNSELSIDCGSGVITEKDPIRVADLPGIVFKPTLFHISHITSLAIKQAIDSNPDGCFRFTEAGLKYKGFPMEIGITGEIEDEYQSTLLATPDCDLLQRII